jgi:hypothetical protein
VQAVTPESHHDHQPSRPRQDRSPGNRPSSDRRSGLQRPGDGLLAPAGGSGGEPTRVAVAAGALAGIVEPIAELAAAILEPRLAEVIAAAIAAHHAPKLLDRRGLAHALNIGVDTVDRLRREGCPSLLVGDAPRFELDQVIQWLRGRA